MRHSLFTIVASAAVAAVASFSQSAESRSASLRTYDLEQFTDARRHLTHNTPENCIKKCNNQCDGAKFCTSKSSCRTGCNFGDQVVGGCGDEVGSLFTNGKGCQKEPTSTTDFSILSDCDQQCGNDNSNFESCHEGCLMFHQILSGSENKGGTKSDEDQQFFAFISCRAICRYSDDTKACRTGCKTLQDLGEFPSNKDDNSVKRKCFDKCPETGEDVKFCEQGCEAMNDLSIGEFKVLLNTPIGVNPNPNPPEDNELEDPVLDEPDDEEAEIAGVDNSVVLVATGASFAGLFLVGSFMVLRNRQQNAPVGTAMRV